MSDTNSSFPTLIAFDRPSISLRISVTPFSLALAYHVALAGIGMLAFFLRIPSLFHEGYWLIDEPSWRILGNLLAQGQVLYKDVVVQLPPTMLLIYSTITYLFGPWADTPVYLFGAAWSAVAVCLIGLTLFAFGERRLGLIAAFLFAVSSTFFRGSEFLSVNGELICNGFYAGSFLLLALILLSEEQGKSLFKRFPLLLLLGVFETLAASVKSQAGILFLCTIFYFALRPLVFSEYRKRFGQLWFAPLISLCIGFGVVIVAFAAYFQSQQALDAALHFMLGNQFVHASEHGQYSVLYFALKLIYRSALLLLASLPVWLLAFLTTKQVLSGHTDFRESLRQLLLFSSIVVLFTWFPTSLGARFFPHYYLLFYVPLSVLAAPAASRYLRVSRSDSKPRKAFAIFLWSFLLGSSLLWFSLNMAGASKFSESIPVELKNYIEENTEDADPIFIWGYAPQWYLDVQRHPSPGFYSIKQLVGAKHGTKGMFLASDASAWERIAADIKGGRDRQAPSDPRYISETAWKIFEKSWSKRPPRVVVDTSPSGFRGQVFPVALYPRIQRLLSRYQGPIRIADMDVYWLQPASMFSAFKRDGDAGGTIKN